MLIFRGARNGPISHAITVNFVDFLNMNIYNLFPYFLILLIMLLSKIILKELLSQEACSSIWILWQLWKIVWIYFLFSLKKISSKKVIPIVKTITKCNKLKHKRPISIKYLHKSNFSHFNQGVNNVPTLMPETRKITLVHEHIKYIINNHVHKIYITYRAESSVD